MVPFILTPRDLHTINKRMVKSASEYLVAQVQYITKQKKAGMRYEVHESPTPIVAYVSSNRWVANCECGAGNATDPEWGLACCFGCGAIHRNVVFPDQRAAIEQVLLERSQDQTRNWFPHETVDELQAENVAAGIGDTP